ncbi:hypothetical protein PVL29_021170 [Vitis rotundifolia]|uniref:Retrotransposon Copia-like N-terminal domain-containing protein n=1 Tax=Vitis rotundifolia TaxID=103349 RepID=A0AA38YYU0_VITRO|nr:hypothetical protein PVL29_021170 [Vitis rotundifolia]
MVTSLETSSDSSFPLNPIISLSSQLVMVKLTDENFLIWKQQSLNLEYVTWQRQNQLLVSWLLSSMSESILPQMVGCSTANDIWRTLDKVFAIRCKTKIMQYKL